MENQIHKTIYLTVQPFGLREWYFYQPINSLVMKHTKYFILVVVLALFSISLFTKCGDNSEISKMSIDSVFVSTMELRNTVQLDSVYLKFDNSPTKFVGLRSYYKTSFLDINQLIIKPNQNNSEVIIYFEENNIMDEINGFLNTSNSFKEISNKIYLEVLKNIKIDVISQNLKVNSLRINQTDRVKLKIKANRI
jgi:hypothetical protein